MIRHPPLFLIVLTKQRFFNFWRRQKSRASRHYPPVCVSHLRLAPRFATQPFQCRGYWALCGSVDDRRFMLGMFQSTLAYARIKARCTSDCRFVRADVFFNGVGSSRYRAVAEGSVRLKRFQVYLLANSRTISWHLLSLQRAVDLSSSSEQECWQKTAKLSLLDRNLRSSIVCRLSGNYPSCRHQQPV